jgi:hypothetical protein
MIKINEVGDYGQKAGDAREGVNLSKWQLSLTL